MPNEQLTDIDGSGRDDPQSFEYDITPEDIEINWQHPRHPGENAVLLVWPTPLRDKWAVEVDDGIAWAVSHTVLYEDADGNIKPRTRSVDPNDPLPTVVARAILGYTGEYGPVETLVNDWGGDE
ncbi:hypothetical protein [Halosegnis longus]|uniref:hypothetical protein n=1 Tax=Halosegnis longus TaxID=2216012 RepID=UPI00129ED300|nr:hypothetical protein [Halosegnis longus]